MPSFFCSVTHKATDRRLTLCVSAIDHEQAKQRATAEFDKIHPRKIGEIRQLDVSASTTRALIQKELI